MNTSKLKNFAQTARRRLRDQVGGRIEAALMMEGAAAAENARAIAGLKRAIVETSKAAVIDRVAYIWFNRFCALRYMDANDYTPVRIVSPAEGATQPELLSEAKQGIVREEFQPFVDQKRVNDLLTGNLRSDDAQGEAYRLLVVGVCNYYHKIMPYLFEQIDDYSELLMPLDLLSDDSILAATRRAMDAEACENVEVIGWLYQFYISERKDEVFASKKKVAAEDIPAATQLFTPNWIVRYLVENSLGRLWMLNHPGSRLKDKMDYYIEPEQQEEDFLVVKSPEVLRILDPACGSGHMLVYAFDLLYAIYEEAGYAPSSIPTLILTHNLYGVEIDERAGTLAGFALTMKAREKHRRFFRDPVEPNICIMEDIDATDEELSAYRDAVGSDLFTFDLATLLHQFKDATHFGSLIRPIVTDVADLLATLREKNLKGQMFIDQTHRKVLKALSMASYLDPNYHIVVANPPYMGGGNMNSKLKTFAKGGYKDTKADLFAMFIERDLRLIRRHGYVAMITMHSWMFLSTYEKLRKKLLKQDTIISMAHLGSRAFDTIGGEVVQTTAFVLENAHREDHKGAFLRLVDGNSEAEKQAALQENKRSSYRASAADFKKIPGSPIAYWVSRKIVEIFDTSPLLEQFAEARKGLVTLNDAYFTRVWSEVSTNHLGFGVKDRQSAIASSKKWFPINKGGGFRKWYGLNGSVINWLNDGRELKEYIVERYGGGSYTKEIRSEEFYFQPNITWGSVTSGSASFRYTDSGFLFSSGGSSLFPRRNFLFTLALLNSALVSSFLTLLNPTLNYVAGNISKLPLVLHASLRSSEIIAEALVNLAKADWDAYETSWDFADLPLLRAGFRYDTLVATYANLRDHWRSMTLDMQRLEEENNRIFIDACGLQDELTPDVPLEEITLTCNPYYRYKSSNKSDEELEALLLADTMREFVSYAVGCMFGRYALEKPGLVLANQGETQVDYLRQVPNPSFPADQDNVLPIMGESWFTDDIVDRFYAFLRRTFGDEHFNDNLRFIEDALGKDIRSYFVRDFYDDHVKRYQKRPIYWLFSSPNGSFNALIYMHRYRPDTVSVVLNNYLREFRSKLQAQIDFQQVQSNDALASKADRTAALKDVDRLKKVVRELDDYERDVLYPLATKSVKIDLDDGVKVNCAKFGDALKTIKGLNA